MKQIDGYKVYTSRLLGKGTYGEVYEGLSDQTKERVAIKMIRKALLSKDQYLKNAIMQQIKILSKLSSPYIVGCRDVMQSSKYFYIVQQLCQSDLQKLMKEKKFFAEKQAIQKLIQISHGFLKLVQQGIRHRDLKPANILLKDGQVKICDFGFAKKVGDCQLKNSCNIGTPLYMSLQVLKGEPNTSKTDIWAIGVIFYEMLHGCTPWKAKNQHQLILAIQKETISINEGLSSSTKKFLKDTLEKEQENRISWDSYFNHEIFNGYFQKYLKKNQELQNKLKTVMASLRFKINSQNLNLNQVLSALGYNDPKQQLDFMSFNKFLVTINPCLSQEQAIYIFSKTDIDDSGQISISQIEHQMAKYNIEFNGAVINHDLDSQSKQSKQEHIKRSEKIKKCFQRLYQTMQKKQLSLYKVFKTFVKDKSNKLSLKQWKTMIRKITGDLTEEQLEATFQEVDEDGSNTIQYDQLNKYFCRANGLPIPNLKMDLQKPIEDNDKQHFLPKNQQNNKLNIQTNSSNYSTNYYHNNQMFEQQPIYPQNQPQFHQNPYPHLNYNHQPYFGQNYPINPMNYSPPPHFYNPQFNQFQGPNFPHPQNQNPPNNLGFIFGQLMDSKNQNIKHNNSEQ